MQTTNWMTDWKMTLITWILLVFLSMAVPVSSQYCFSDIDDGIDVSLDATEDGAMDFAIALFKSVVKNPSKPPASGNIHISSATVRAVFAFLYMGAKGNTKTEMATALRFENLKQKMLLQLYRELKSELEHNATMAANYTVSVSDKLYFDNNVMLRKCIFEHLESEIQQVDFRSAPEPSRQLINKWVKDQTKNKIVDLIPQGNINSDTIMVVVNAIYFKAAWAKIFDPRATTNDDFYIQPQQSKKVSTMHQTITVPYGSSTLLDCTAMALPYSGDDMDMVIVLPNTNVNVKDVIAKLSTKNLKDLFGNLKPTTVKLSLPKLKLTQSFELTDNMKALGMNDAFDASKADLSGFTGSKNIFVSFVRHKTFIQVDEAGTEAAAATAGGVSTTAIIVAKTEFRVDRPYLFFIRNINHNRILFTGLVNDPTAQE